MVNHLLKPISLVFSHRPYNWFFHILHYLPNIVQFGFGVCLCDQKGCGIQDVFLYFIILEKSIDEIFNSCLEFFTCTLKIHFLKGQDKFQFRSLRKSSVMEVTIGENPMKTITISISRLIQHSNSLEFTIFIYKLRLKDVGYFSLWLRGDSHCCSHVLLSGRTIDVVSVGKLGFQGRVGQDMAWWCLTHLSKAEDGHCLVEELKEGNVSSLYCTKEALCLLLDGQSSFLHLYLLWQDYI